MRFFVVLLSVGVFVAAMSYGTQDPYSRTHRVYTEMAAGSSFGIEYRGHVMGMTAGHVCATSLTGELRFDDGSRHKIVNMHQALDICVFEYTGPAFHLEALPLELGSPVTIIGYPGHIGPVTSHGELLYLRDKFLVVTAPAYFGNSGGPMLINGQVAGLVDAVKDDFSVTYVIPVESITDALSQLYPSKPVK